jgi:hypothetical protein
VLKSSCDDDDDDDDGKNEAAVSHTKKQAAAKSKLDVEDEVNTGLTSQETLSEEEEKDVYGEEEQDNDGEEQEESESYDPAEGIIEDDHSSQASGEDEEDEDEFNPYAFIKSLPAYELVAHTRPKIGLPPKDVESPPISLVLDLDETLVHCTVEPVDDADLIFPVVFHGMTYQVHVRLRPHLMEFLNKIKGKYEVIVFTASQKVYANELLNLIDPGASLTRTVSWFTCRLGTLFLSLPLCSIFVWVGVGLLCVCLCFLTHALVSLLGMLRCQTYLQMVFTSSTGCTANLASQSRGTF